MDLSARYPALVGHLDVCQVDRALNRLNALAERVVELEGQIDEVQAQGMARATPYWRDHKYLYLVHQQCDGRRRREYIGMDGHKQAAALQRIENWRQYQQLVQERKRAQGNLDYGVRELCLSLSRIAER
jgi:hypothetical protein